MTGARGLVVTTDQAAADAGASALTAGGTAVDALVAAAFAMCVVDPANCGVGGYGGFLVYAPAAGPVVRVDFNTWVPSGFAAAFAAPGETEVFVRGGGSVAPPAVVAGLVTAREHFGRVPLADLVAPATVLARDGFTIGHDLAAALASHRGLDGPVVPEFASIFYAGERVPVAGERLVQADLAVTLEAIARSGREAFASGEIAGAVCETVQADSGFLVPGDLERDTTVVGLAESAAFGTAVVFAPARQTSGAGVLFDALAGIDQLRLGPTRGGPAYAAEVRRALAAAWERRLQGAGRSALARHTTQLSAADADGGCGALTLTHGSLDFGSGLVAVGTGIVLNAGANLFADSAEGPRAVTNMTPSVVVEEDGTRHALGATGGPRIPAMVLTAVTDVVCYGATLSEAIAAPHFAVHAADGSLEAEDTDVLAEVGGPPVRSLRAGESFGPMCGVTVRDGVAVAGIDPRFPSGVA